MIIDHELVMSDAQAITDASAASTSYIDSLAAADAMAPGARIQILVDTSFAVGSGSPTLVLALQCDDNSSFSSPKTLITTAALAYGAMTAGTVLVDAVIPLGCERYIRSYYTVGGTGAFNAGKVDARIVLDTDKTMDKLL